MPDVETLLEILGETVVAIPTLLLVLLGVTSFIGRPFSERVTGALVQVAVVAGLVVSVVILAMMLALDTRQVPIELGNWVQFQDHDFSNPVLPARAATHHVHHGAHHGVHYHFAVKFVFDRLSVPFVILTFLLCGTIGKFAIRYMHREGGFNRFFALYAMFMLGMIVTSLAGTIETLFAGWELVGLSSALLVAFYHDRPGPVRNGLRVWIVYRISDAALLFASVALHHMRGGGDFSKFLGDAPWPEATSISPLSAGQALIVGSLLLIAAMGKSALVPFSGWLPRAMEGPTPSSAVFYGALSVHLGAFLLLRVSPLLDDVPGLCLAIVVIGLTSSIFSAFAGRVQTDIKSALSFASLTQVGFITAEIGIASLAARWIDPKVGEYIRYFALIHILGHGCLRTLQFVRAPSLLRDYRILENAIGDHLPHKAGRWEWISPGVRVWFYRLAIERGYLDACLHKFFVAPFLAVFRFFDRIERRWMDFLSGSTKNEPTDSEAATGLEDVR
jgi:NADH:ubiquinone oxidoreductase subunit 5 (subunit L)/multisubunit Na+/H+ antiporter MnhA subunit